MYNNLKKSLSYPVITIDGLSGSGKGTISFMLAREIGWNFLDSGALYRSLAFLYTSYFKKDSEITTLNESVLEKLAFSLQVNFIDNNQVIIYDLENKEKNITQLIRTEQCGNLASKIAVLPKVRAALLVKQHDNVRSPGLVADGRDMGTVVFPEAILKFFFIANAKIRANRRYLQLKAMGVDVKLHNLIEEVSERDSRDMQRSVASLRSAEDAILIDTTNMTIDELFNVVMEKVIVII